MYGLVEVDVSTIHKAYSFLKYDASLDISCDGRIERHLRAPTKSLKQASHDKTCIFTKEELTSLSEVLSEIIYASFISSSEQMYIKIEIASFIQDIIDFYAPELEKV